MIGDWLKSLIGPAPARPAPPNEEIFAVGDIHGRLDLLCDLLERILDARTTERPELVFLGDYVDRGPDSAGVIDLLLSEEMGQMFRPTFLKGNHEATLVSFLQDPSVGPSWVEYGGGETLLSYGVTPPSFKNDESAWIEASRHLSAVLPETHRTFFEELELSAERGPYFFVHAGVDPDKKLHEQGEAEFLWIRERFLQDTRRLDRIIVHGHTPEPEPFEDDRRIGLDLGGYQTGRLAAARIYGGKVSFLTT